LPEHPVLDERRAVLRGLEAIALQWAADRDDEQAAALCQLAADYAWRNHAGVFTSPALEETLEVMGHRCAQGHGHRRDRTAVRDVLHVMTAGFAVGGHTRLVQRWVQLDSTRSHSLALTATRAQVPKSVEEAVWSTDGDLYRLGDTRRSLLSRARRLRELAGDFDMVVLHTHPFDVVPTIAFAGPTNTPVALLNHADHGFWIGVRSSDRIINLRAAGANLCVNRRGIAPTANLLLPIPIATIDRQEERGDAKRRLGLTIDDVLIVTMGRPEKYMPRAGQGFLDTVAPALLANERCTIIAIGPTSTRRWEQLKSQSAGRLRAIGPRPDPSLYLDAADLYVDSFPFSSLTSLLEAGARGTPCLAYLPPRPGAEVLGPDDPALLGFLSGADSPEALADLCSSVALDVHWRSEVGGRLRQAIEATHTGPGWRQRCDTIYRQLLTPAGSVNSVPGRDPDPPGLLDDILSEYPPVSLPRLAIEQLGYLGRNQFPLVATAARLTVTRWWPRSRR
jgi:glycosyltransferase involved in cell wall biosynthesis